MALSSFVRELGSQAGAAVISNSWGFGGELAGESAYDHFCQLSAGVCTFSTGDLGNPGGYPAYNPAVIAVGGTSLDLTAAGAVGPETGWFHSGGGLSAFEPRPAYQDKVNTFTARGIPEVSFDADPQTGVAVYDSASGGWVELGGTSTGAPAWAAILAVADQLRAAHGKRPLTAAGYEAQRALYQLCSGLYDVTTGSNGGCGAVCTAGPGYDFVTGLGSPRAGIDTALAAAS
jgi:subtilase family serine protease